MSAHSDGRGKGSRFTVTLPAAHAPQALPQPEPAAPAAVGPLRVLLIEDNTDARDSLAGILRLLGHEVAEAADGAAGLEIAEQFRPDVALIDVGLPGMNGYEVARRLRERDATRKIRMVALTGYGQPKDKRQASAAGFDFHVTKPIPSDGLQDLLRRVASGS